jgi:hypothetical protein
MEICFSAPLMLTGFSGHALKNNDEEDRRF